jgi:hypothetical protein
MTTSEFGYDAGPYADQDWEALTDEQREEWNVWSRKQAEEATAKYEAERAASHRRDLAERFAIALVSSEANFIHYTPSVALDLADALIEFLDEQS